MVWLVVTDVRSAESFLESTQKERTTAVVATLFGGQRLINQRREVRERDTSVRPAGIRRFILPESLRVPTSGDAVYVPQPW